jgi:hypothetical protein
MGSIFWPEGAPGSKKLMVIADRFFNISSKAPFDGG